MRFLKAAVAAGLLVANFAGSAQAQNKPQEIKIGITTFLSGPASVFGVPAKAGFGSFNGSGTVSPCANSATGAAINNRPTSSPSAFEW